MNWFWGLAKNKLCHFRLVLPGLKLSILVLVGLLKSKIQNPKSKIQNRISPILKLSSLGLSVALLVVACSGSTPNSPISDRSTINLNSSDCRIVKHDLGQTNICGQPQKIVALGPHILDLLLSLDRQPAGYAEVFPFHGKEYFDNPREQIPYLGNRVTTQPMNLGNRGEPSLEALSKLRPDLILGEAGGLEDKYELFSRIAPTLLWEQRTAKGKWQQTIRQLAKAIGREQKAEQMIETYNQNIAAARTEFAPIVAKYPKLLLLGGNQLSGTLSVVDGSGYLGEILEGVGFQVMSPPAQMGSEITTSISLEILPQLGDADTIFILGYNLNVGNRKQKANLEVLNNVIDQQTATLQEDWEENAIAQSLKASQEGRVFFTTYYLWNGLNGPIGAELILDELRRLLL
ncbi:MAG TPA: iron-siderophore ABC transporter substrate-binding protein [Cyanobacteria bacterium UBA11162]|nr:iron-siderophore ABC transporter substrate-binding protein [Cyanobacteria bacterium UBA11162]